MRIPIWFPRRTTLRAVLASITLICLALGFVAYLRTPPAIVRRITRLGGEVRVHFSRSNWPAVFVFAESRLGPFHRLSDIWSIKLDSHQFGDSDMRAVCVEPLEVLHIRSNAVTDHGLQFLKSSRHIDELVLFCPSISDEGLASIQSMPWLNYLAVSSKHVTGKFLTQVRNKEKLETLILHGPAIDDIACKMISELYGLRDIDMSRTKVTDAGLMALAKGVYLEHLNITDTNVTRGGLLAFMESKPNVEVKANAPVPF